MKYCYRLLNEINFEPTFISPCCNTQNILVPQMPYTGGEVDLEAYSKYIEKVFEQIQTEQTICHGCRDLVDVDNFPGHKGKFKAISINMHRFFCNCKCEYCNLWNHKNKRKFYDILPALKSLKAQNAIANGAFISWGGGEPTLIPEFDAATKFLHDSKCIQYVHSNAIKFSLTLADLLTTNTCKVNISLDSGTREGYEKVKGVDCFPSVVKNIKQYSKYGHNNVVLKYIIYEKSNNIEDIKNFLNIAQGNRIKDIHLSFDFREQNAGLVSEQSLKAAAFLVMKAALGGLKVSPFYVDKHLLDQINSCVHGFATQPVMEG